MAFGIECARRFTWPAWSLAAALLLTTPAAADDASTCHNASGSTALNACNRAIGSNRYSGNDLAKLYTSRGVELKMANRLMEAIADYDQAIALNPTDHFAFNNRANARRDNKDIAGAIDDYTEALRLDPGYTAAYVNRARVYVRMNRIDLARADFEQAVNRKPKYNNGPGSQRAAKEELAALRLKR